MTYTTPSEIRGILRNLPSSMVDKDILVFIDKAEAYIDSKLGGAYYVPFNPPPRIIRHLATDLSAFFLVEALATSQKPNLDEYWIKKYERANEMLKGIADGDIDIGVSQKNSSGFATTNTRDPIFDFDTEW